MIACYILYSLSLKTYYIGITNESVESRLEKHTQHSYGKHFTSTATDWQIFLVLPCDSVAQSMKIEKHIKKMKSRIYLSNLKKYPEIFQKLKLKYSE